LAAVQKKADVKSRNLDKHKYTTHDHPEQFHTLEPTQIKPLGRRLFSFRHLSIGIVIAVIGLLVGLELIFEPGSGGFLHSLIDFRSQNSSLILADVI